MRTLNLANPGETDVKFKVIAYPDGQQDIIIQDFSPPGMEYKFKEHYFKTVSVKILSRLNSWLDLEIIATTVAALRRMKVREIHLVSPYILGARSDRKFQKGGSSYLRDVVAPVVNSLRLDSVTCMDPHSYVVDAVINNLEIVDNTELVGWAHFDICKNRGGETDISQSVIFCPDAGALHKIYHVAEDLDYTDEIVICSKQRNLKGEITATHVPFLPEYSQRDVLLIDDICDGGRTFIEIVKKAEEEGYMGRKFLIITHGIFSQGIGALENHFHTIYCTDSVKSIDHKQVKQLKLF